jgi:flagellar biosynthesis/type III secretory pathway M-ring protein FliF/YscJ
VNIALIVGVLVLVLIVALTIVAVVWLRGMRRQVAAQESTTGPRSDLVRSIEAEAVEIRRSAQSQVAGADRIQHELEQLRRR